MKQGAERHLKILVELLQEWAERDEETAKVYEGDRDCTGSRVYGQMKGRATAYRQCAEWIKEELAEK